MTGIIVCLSAAVLGVDYGWQPVAGGGIEYIIQIEPELLDALRSGNDIFSDLPDSVRNIRSYRITVGTGRLPHHGEPPPASTVVPAGGSAAAPQDGRATDGQKSVEIDLSQLPGPVRGPALFLDARGNSLEDDEPPHIAEADAAKPLRNRVAGYHESREPDPVHDPDTAAHQDAEQEASNEVAGAKSAAAEKRKSQDNRIAEIKEPESSSDHAAEKADAAAVKPALVQLGLLTSLGCNAFLLWVATGQRNRYRALVRRMFDGPVNDLAQPADPPAILPRWEHLPPAENEEGPHG